MTGKNMQDFKSCLWSLKRLVHIKINAVYSSITVISENHNHFYFLGSLPRIVLCCGLNKLFFPVSVPNYSYK